MKNKEIEKIIKELKHFNIMYKDDKIIILYNNSIFLIHSDIKPNYYYNEAIDKHIYYNCNNYEYNKLKYIKDNINNKSNIYTTIQEYCIKNI